MTILILFNVDDEILRLYMEKCLTMLFRFSPRDVNFELNKIFFWDNVIVNLFFRNSNDESSFKGRASNKINPFLWNALHWDINPNEQTTTINFLIFFNYQ